VDYKTYKLKITFTGPILGSQPGKDTPASDYIRSEARKRGIENIQDEEDSLPEAMEKGTTGFHRNEKGIPILYNYMIKGALKESAKWQNGLNGMKALRSKVESTIYVFPRQLPIKTKYEKGKDGRVILGCLERPLRAETMQGSRVALARSEMIPEGAVIECELKVVKIPRADINKKMLKDLLDFASLKGIGQWRNSGLYGAFNYELKEKRQ